MKIIAFYLPQFHNIPENDKWWGDGFTEWTNVKKAVPVFEGHKQPRIPLNGNYYNLLDDEVKIWQANLAKKYGIYGFCYYHYWFNGKMLLEKPMEQMLANPKIDIPFCISWANEPWRKTWVGEYKELISQSYGEKEEWKEHFEYLLPFFLDKRYIYKDGKPFFVIYKPNAVSCMSEMMDYWDFLAKEVGLKGICFAFQDGNADWDNDPIVSKFDYDIEFQPLYARHAMLSEKGVVLPFLKKIRRKARNFYTKVSGRTLSLASTYKFYKITKNNIVRYEKVWESILEQNPLRENSIPGAFVRWDNTPRYGEMGQVFETENPEIFKKYLSAQIKRGKEKYHSDMLFLYAWNEWAEGGFMEPDEYYGHSFLEAVKDALDENNEFPFIN